MTISKIRHRIEWHLSRVLQRTTRLGSDEGGSIMLLSSMMMFLGAVFAVIALDTNMAIHDRIVAQNAVDAAADSAALWQARACNVLQQLNNLHYQIDRVAYFAESGAFVSCGVAAVLFPELPWTAIPWAFATAACDTAPVIDWFQQMANMAITNTQQMIVSATPIWVLCYANSMAAGSGADELTSVLGQYVGGLFENFHLPDTLGSSMASVSSVVKVPIYAAPLPPSSNSPEDPAFKSYPGNAASLHVAPYPANTKSQKAFPWYYAEQFGDAVEVFAPKVTAGTWTEVEGVVKALGWDGVWGWQDQYYQGNPGYMTWIAGKQQRGEMAGLGMLRWLNGGSPPAEIQYSFMGQSNLRMYSGPGNDSTSPFTIPAFVALASSQVEGTPVIASPGGSGGVDAVPRLIQVYLPFSNDSPGEDIGILH